MIQKLLFKKMILINMFLKYILIFKIIRHTVDIYVLRLVMVFNMGGTKNP